MSSVGPSFWRQPRCIDLPIDYAAQAQNDSKLVSKLVQQFPGPRKLWQNPCRIIGLGFKKFWALLCRRGSPGTFAHSQHIVPSFGNIVLNWRVRIIAARTQVTRDEG